MMAKGRLNKELEELKASTTGEVISASLVDNQIALWEVTIVGPQNTPYEGGKFVVHIDFRDNYPFKSPEIYFKTKIYHPSID